MAKAVEVPYQTINAIISGRRNITLETTLNIEKTLSYDEGFLHILQDFHNISVYKEQKSKEKYDHAPNIRKSLFGDSDFNKIDWERYKKAVISRVWERGNQSEMKEIARLYEFEITVKEMNLVYNQIYISLFILIEYSSFLDIKE